MIRLGRAGLGARHGQQRLQARVAPAGHDLQAQTGQGPVEAGQAGDVADGAEGGEIEPLADIRLGPVGEQAPLARLAVEGGQQDEDHARRREIALPRGVPRPVRVHDGQTGRRLLTHHMVVDDHDLQTDGAGVRDGLVGRRSAVDGDDQIGARGL